MSGFQEYPKMMVHPHAVAAVLSTIFPLGYKPRDGERELTGSPARYPPVTVSTPDQQGEYEAKGYIAEGGNDVASFNEAMSGKPTHYKYDEYPKWVNVGGEQVLMLTQAHEHATLGYNDTFVKPEMEVKPKNKGGRPPKVKPIHDHMSVVE